MNILFVELKATERYNPRKDNGVAKLKTIRDTALGLHIILADTTTNDERRREGPYEDISRCEAQRRIWLSITDDSARRAAT
jgi:hypothetical protein